MSCERVGGCTTKASFGLFFQSGSDGIMIGLISLFVRDDDPQENREWRHVFRVWRIVREEETNLLIDAIIFLAHSQICERKMVECLAIPLS